MLKPLYDNVILKKEAKEAKTFSGIILGNNKEDAVYATVIAVGDKCGEENTPAVSIGDKVIFKKYSTTDVKIDDDEFMIISCKDILAVIE